MGQWPSTKAGRVLAALLHIDWSVKRQGGGSHKVLERADWPDYVWAFHDGVEIGPVMLSRIAKQIAKQTGLTPRDL